MLKYPDYDQVTPLFLSTFVIDDDTARFFDDIPATQDTFNSEHNKNDIINGGRNYFPYKSNSWTDLAGDKTTPDISNGLSVALDASRDDISPKRGKNRKRKLSKNVLESSEEDASIDKRQKRWKDTEDSEQNKSDPKSGDNFATDPTRRNSDDNVSMLLRILSKDQTGDMESVAEKDTKNRSTADMREYSNKTMRSKSPGTIVESLPFPSSGISEGKMDSDQEHIKHGSHNSYGFSDYIEMLIKAILEGSDNSMGIQSICETVRDLNPMFVRECRDWKAILENVLRLSDYFIMQWKVSTGWTWSVNLKETKSNH